MGRLPTIKEYTEFITEKEIEKEKSSSTRIRWDVPLLPTLST